jgi:hypothetical protein
LHVSGTDNEVSRGSKVRENGRMFCVRVTTKNRSLLPTCSRIPIRLTNCVERAIRCYPPLQLSHWSALCSPIAALTCGFPASPTASRRLSKPASLDRWGFNGDNVAIWPRSTHVCCSASHLTPCQTPSLGISYLGSIKHFASMRLLGRRRWTNTPRRRCILEPTWAHSCLEAACDVNSTPRPVNLTDFLSWLVRPFTWNAALSHNSLWSYSFCSEMFTFFISERCPF